MKTLHADVLAESRTQNARPESYPELGRLHRPGTDLRTSAPNRASSPAAPLTYKLAPRENFPGRVLEGSTVSTDSRVHLSAIEELTDLGATHVAVRVATPNQTEVIDFFGRKALPAMRNG